MNNILMGLKVMLSFFKVRGRNFWKYGAASLAMGVSFAMMLRSIVYLLLDMITLGFIHPGYLGMFLTSLVFFTWCLGYLENEDTKLNIIK